MSEATEGDMPAIARRLAESGTRHQFHPVWDEKTLRSTSRCRGINPDDFSVIRNEDGLRASVCLWDQRKFKQSVVAGYSKRYSNLRPFFNLVAPLMRQPRLPAPGNNLENAFLSHLSVDEDDELALFALIRHASRRALARGIDYVMLGIASRHPLVEKLQKKFSCHRYSAMLYLVYWPDGEAAAAKIDDRLPHPEMAIL